MLKCKCKAADTNISCPIFSVSHHCFSGGPASWKHFFIAIHLAAYVPHLHLNVYTCSSVPIFQPSPALNEKAHFRMLLAVISHCHWPSDIKIEFFFVHYTNYANHRVHKLWNNKNGSVMLLIAVFAVTARQTTSNCALKIEFLINATLLWYSTSVLFNRKQKITHQNNICM